MEARLTEISLPDALRYLGVRGDPDPSLREDLLRCAEELRGAVRPRAVWRLFDREADGALAGTTFRPAGEEIRRFLSGCGRVILMAATLGAEAESLLFRAQRRAMADAVLLDALASAAIENVCDNLCLDLAARFAPGKLTSRFSPGYGDFPLSQQGELCAVLNVSRLLGITLTPGGLMVPQKSVTALVGVRDPSRKGKPGPEGAAAGGCQACALEEDCLYRKGGISCGR